MAPVFFAEKDFSRIFNNIHGYETVFLDRIRERQWYELVYDNKDLNAYYCPELVKKFYLRIDATAINLDLNQFLIHLDHGDLLITLETIKEVTQIPAPPQHTVPLPLIDYMTLMDARCTKLDRGLRASTTFHNIHSVGRWIQRNILSIDHMTSFKKTIL